MKIKLKGAAIIVALFLVSLVASISIYMLNHFRSQIYQTDSIQNYKKATAYANGSILWAIDQLNQNGKKTEELKDHFPLSSPTDTIEQIKVRSEVIDLQKYFNINNLYFNDYELQFSKLLSYVEPKLSPEKKTSIIKNIQAWLKLDTQDKDLAEIYSKNNPSYQMAHHLFASTSELRLIEGITDDLYYKLVPYITALPEKTTLNINTALPPVLFSVSPQLSLNSAIAITDHKQQPYTSMAQFGENSIVRNNSLPLEKLTIVSNYFLIKTTVKIKNQSINLFTWVKRDTKNHHSSVYYLWQTKGIL